MNFLEIPNLVDNLIESEAYNIYQRIDKQDLLDQGIEQFCWLEALGKLTNLN